MKKIKLEVSEKLHQISINTLPNEVLIEILQYLDINSLKSAINVCKLWSKIIKSSAAIAKSFKIELKGLDQQNLQVSIPIDGLMYRKIHLKGLISIHNIKFNEILQKYGKNIQQVVLDDCSTDGYWIFKHQLKLNSLKIQISSGCDLETQENSKKFLSCIIADETNSLRHLSAVGLEIESKTLEKVVNFKNLKKLELEMKVIESSGMDLIFEKYNKKFTKLTFLNPKVSQKELVRQICSKFKDLKVLKIIINDSGSSLPTNLSFFDEIPNFKSAKFEFCNPESDKNFESFKNLKELSINRLDNESQLKKIINFLKKAKNLTKLEINLISNRSKFDKNFEQFFESANNIVELHIDAYSDKFDISINNFEIIKKKASKLRELFIKVGSSRIDDIRNRSRILLETKVQVVVMEKEIVSTSLENCNKKCDKSLCIFET